MFKNELVEGFIIKCCAPRAKTYSYLADDYDHDDDDKNKINKKAKGTKKCVIKREHKFKYYHDLVFENKTIIRSQLRFKSHHHNLYTEEVNTIAISSSEIAIVR